MNLQTRRKKMDNKILNDAIKQIFNSIIFDHQNTLYRNFVAKNKEFIEDANTELEDAGIELKDTAQYAEVSGKKGLRGAINGGLRAAAQRYIDACEEIEAIEKIKSREYDEPMRAIEIMKYNFIECQNKEQENGSLQA
jgi:hypothetical protein